MLKRFSIQRFVIRRFLFVTEYFTDLDHAINLTQITDLPDSVLERQRLPTPRSMCPRARNLRVSTRGAK